MRGKSNERIGKIDNRFLVLRKQSVCADDEPEDERASEIHLLTLNKKGQAAKATWPFCRKRPWTGRFRRRGYFEYPCVELAVDVVAAASLCCAHAPKLRAPAKTAMIMIALMNFNLVSPPFGCVASVLLGVEHPRSNAFLDVLPV